jgi:hypothetical protein
MALFAAALIATFSIDSPTGYAAALIVAAVLVSPGVEIRRAPTPQTV